jgi:hypothetical protein
MADLAGDDWAVRARTAASTMTGAEAQQEEDTSASVRLLGDLREVFGDDDALYSSTILERLHKLEEAPWADWYGRLLSTRDLAKLLRPYDVRAKNLRERGGEPRKGYTRADLHEPWSRYLPLHPLHPPQQDEAAGQPDQLQVADPVAASVTSATAPDPVAHVADPDDSSATGLTSEVADVADVADSCSTHGESDSALSPPGRSWVDGGTQHRPPTSPPTPTGSPTTTTTTRPTTAHDKEVTKQWDR